MKSHCQRHVGEVAIQGSQNSLVGDHQDAVSPPLQLRDHCVQPGNDVSVRLTTGVPVAEVECHHSFNHVIKLPWRRTSVSDMALIYSVVQFKHDERVQSEDQSTRMGWRVE